MVQIKSIFCFLLILGLFGPAHIAARDVNFHFKAGTTRNVANKSTMERNASALLSEIDRAGRTNTSLNLTGISMEENAKKKLIGLWKDARFTVDETEVISNCLQDMQGYQARGISLTVIPYDDSYKQKLDRELTISFDRNGVITGARLALELQEEAEKIYGKDMAGVEDIRERLEVLKWVEDFRCYYNEKDLESIRQIFSDDALIITGSVQMVKKNSGDGVVMVPEVSYKKQDKAGYMNNLERVFHNNRHINVQFENIQLKRSGSMKDIYGVKLRQNWKGDRYFDQGWVLLIWDFKDRDHPEILVRTWQPLEYVKETGTLELEDFIIPKSSR